MAKSVSGQDMEDMLSSVRRLVSSELPRHMRTSRRNDPGALVLTESQRVESAKSPRKKSGMTLEDRIAELEAAVSGSPDEWEPDGSEDQAQHQPDRIVYRTPDEPEASGRRRSLRLSEIALIETGPANETESASPDADAAEDVSFRHEAGEEELDTSDFAEIHEDAETLESESEIEEIEELEEIEAIEPAEGDEAADLTASDTSASEIADNGQEPEADDDQEAQHIINDEEDVDAALDEAISDFDAELAKAVAESLDESELEQEPEHSEVAPEQSVLMDEADTQPDEADVPESIDPEFEDAAPEISMVAPLPEEALDDGEEFEIDEDALRPLVAALLREELQGEIGERITRNVRKLVRQEIQRALAVRELE